MIDLKKEADYQKLKLEVEQSKTLTIRDQFAMAALTGLVAANYGRKDVDPLDVASWAYGIADAMMEARK
jgi:hypothetical protein